VNVTSDVNKHKLVVVRDGAVLHTKFSHDAVAENNCVQLALEVLFHAVCKLLLDPLRLSEVDFLHMSVGLVQKSHLCL
jgi:hypothetical protein